VATKQLYDVLEKLVKSELLTPRSVEGRRMYAFASDGVKDNVRRLAAPEVQRRYRAEDELERVWSAWLAHETETLATPAQVRYLARYGADLKPQAAKALLLLRSAVAGNEPAGPWLDWLRTQEGSALIQQLEDPATLHGGKTDGSDMAAKARQLLGLDDETLPKPPEGGQGFGAVAWAAARHPRSVAWQTAALALTAPEASLALEHHLNTALYAGLQGWPRLKRASQLQGTLADADPQRARSGPPLAGSNPLLVWGWRAGRRIARERQRVVGLALGGAIGAGVGLGLLRMALGIPARQLLGVQFAIYFYWAAILGAAMGGGMALAEPLVLSGEPSSAGRKLARMDRLALLTVGVGTIAFGFAHLLVAWLNGLSLPKAPLVAPLGFAAALGLSLALYNQPRAGWRLGIVGWLGRLGIAALSFALIQWAFIAAKNQGPGIAIAWAGSFYRANLSWIGLAWWQQLTQRAPQWYDYLALADAALVGIVLTVGITAGLVVAADRSARWRDLTERAGD
jgi:hypothetical protein